MPEITNEFMLDMISKAKNYSLVILKKTDKYNDPEIEKILYEHGRRNFALREAGFLSVTCRIKDESDISGVGIFDATPDEVKLIMDEDPGVKAGIFSYDIHLCSSFPGDGLP
jgi:hypothetical protein